jgi:fructan beta-fructosidase
VAQPGPALGAPAAPPEPFRPLFHVTPAGHWMNDPNGLVYMAGEYHLFFQYNPLGDTWGHMSWGHAMSRDLVHWRELPVAIPETDGVMAFSGSAVVDWNNTSSFGRGGGPPLVAMYTGYRGADHRQAQYLAYSTDRGRSRTRYAGNPVLDIGSTEFRDPKLFWYQPEQRWILVVSLAAEHRVRLYGSPDLKLWTLLGEFGPAGAVAGVWECPDLFELPVDGDAENSRWVLIVNLNPGAVAGGSGAQYFVGPFDGTRFIAEEGADTDGVSGDAGKGRAHWADYGKDFYAAVSWSDIPPEDGRRIWIGWMNNWEYGSGIPTAPWRGAMSLPRSLALRTTPRGIRLVQQPVAELARLRGRVRHLGPQPIPMGSTLLASSDIAGSSLEIVAEFDADSAAEFGFKVRTGRDEETVVGVDPRAGEVFVDRPRSGQTGFNPTFGGRQAAPVTMEKGRIRLHLLVDRSSVELFVGAGEAVITGQIFPAPESEGVALYAAGGSARLVSLDAWRLTSPDSVDSMAAPSP